MSGRVSEWESGHTNTQTTNHNNQTTKQTAKGDLVVVVCVLVSVTLLVCVLCVCVRPLSAGRASGPSNQHPTNVRQVESGPPRLCKVSQYHLEYASEGKGREVSLSNDGWCH